MDSRLNPDAPEFFPNLKKVTQDGYLTIKQSVKSSKIFTIKGKYDTLKTHSAFKLVTSNLSGYVTYQIDEIVVAEIPDKCEGPEDIQYNDQFVKSNNNILERFNKNLEELCNMESLNVDDNDDQNIPPVVEVEEVKKQDHVLAEGDFVLNKGEDASQPSSSKIKVNISENIWVPKLLEKPNHRVPFNLKLIYNKDGQIEGYENPYKVELDLYDPPSNFIDPAPEPIPFPAPLKNTNFTFVNTEWKLDELVRHLREADEIAVDLEHHSYRTYQGITCLIQITTFAGDYIIDAVELKDCLHKLNCSFTDPKKIKVLHGADMDVLWLQRDFGVYIVGLFDTHQAAIALELASKSLKALLQLYCKVNTDKKYQTADWRVRPLPQEMIKYARTDTHYLLYIWKRMKNQLLDKDGGEKTSLKSVFNESRKICGTTYKKIVISDTSHLDIYHRYQKDFSTRQMEALKMLYQWRDGYAKQLDESPVYVLPNQMMLVLAEQLPKDLKVIREICRSAKIVLKQNIGQIQNILKICSDMPEDSSPAVTNVTEQQQRQYTHYMLDVPSTSYSGDSGTNVADIAVESNDLLEKTEIEVPCKSAEKKTEELCEIRQVPITAAENKNNDDDLKEFTPIFTKKETREEEESKKDIAEAAEPMRTEEVECYAGPAGSSQRVGKRKRKSCDRIPQTSAPKPEEEQDENSTLASTSKHVYYRYTNPNYQRFYSARGKSGSKSNKKKRK